MINRRIEIAGLARRFRSWSLSSTKLSGQSDMGVLDRSK